MRAPDWFVSELNAFDPLLRLRWSAQRKLWLIERKVLPGLAPGTYTSDPFDDNHIRAREGYLLICSIPPGKLDRRVFEALRAGDLWRTTWNRLADQLDAFEENQENKLWEKFSQNVQDASKDVYELFKLRDGRTVFNAGWVQ